MLEIYYYTQIYLQLALRPLRLFKNRVQLGRLHNIALDLQLAAHKKLLRVRLARDQLCKLTVVQDKCDSGLLALGRNAAADRARLLEVDVP